jgi:iron(III) transport system permease protein
VALPLARPAIAAGLALVMMETLADYGVGAFFGLNTFSTGIFKAWLVLNDALAAAQLASVLMLVVGLLLWLERRAQRRMRFANTRTGRKSAADSHPVRLQKGLAIFAFTLCALPVCMGFVLPVLWLVWQIWHEATYSELQLPLQAFGLWAWNSFSLAALAALLAVVLATLLAFGLRTQHWPQGKNHAKYTNKMMTALARMASLSYAIPGGIIAIGILIPLGIWQNQFPQWGISALVTGTIMGLVYAYLVRFSAVAVQTMDAGYAQISPHLDETARLLGHNRWQLLPRVHLPLLRKSLITAVLLVFVDVMKELPATLVLRPFGSDTLAVMAYQFARDERLAEAALPSMAIVLVGLIPVLLLSRALRPTQHGNATMIH